MARHSNDMTQQETLKDALEFTKANPVDDISPEFANANHCSQIAKECLQVVSSKWIAAEIEVTTRVIQAWSSGEKRIPVNRALQILLATKGYFLDVGRIEAAIDRILVETYGPSDKGRF